MYSTAGSVVCNGVSITSSDGIYLDAQVAGFRNMAEIVQSSALTVTMDSGDGSKQLLECGNFSSIPLSVGVRKELTVYPEVVTYGTTTYPNVSATSLTFFGDNPFSLSNSAYYVYFSKVRFYRGVIFDINGNVKMDLLPCMRDSDGAVGLFDVHSVVFYPHLTFNYIETYTYTSSLIPGMKMQYHGVRFHYNVKSDIVVTYTDWEGTHTKTITKGSNKIASGYSLDLDQHFESITSISIKSDDFMYYYPRTITIRN